MVDYQYSSDGKIQKLSNLLVRDAEKKGILFTLGGEAIYSTEAFASFGGLSLFLIETKEIYEKIYNKNFLTDELLTIYGNQIFNKHNSQDNNTQIKEEIEKERLSLHSKPKKHVFPVEFVEEDNIETLFGFLPRIVGNDDVDFISIAHFTHYAVEEYIKRFEISPSAENFKKVKDKPPIPLDSLYDKMVKKINNKEVVLLKPYGELRAKQIY